MMFAEILQNPLSLFRQFESIEDPNILNAWDATENQFLGQLTIDCKTNEIKAAPTLLKNLNLEGVVVTVDALMTQKAIAETVIEKKGDYVMALKGNHESLYEDVQLYFGSVEDGMSCARSVEKNRGCVETRTCTRARSIIRPSKRFSLQTVKTRRELF